jgi:antagonist of KipI
MQMDIIDVLDGGLLTTVQDRGRYGYQRYGVPVSGAMDQFALAVANSLAGNDERAAGLEITLVGPRLRFLHSTVIALAGADLSPRLDDTPVPAWEPFVAPAGSVLSFGEPRDGARAYLAVHGGIDVPEVLGSRSTHVRSKLGGFGGRPLSAGDRLATPGTEPPRAIDGRRMAPGLAPRYGHSHRLRVVPGPQHTAFTPKGLETLLSAAYTVTSQSDRIGCRLQGPPIEHATSPDIVSDAVPAGAIQVAGDGMPIVLLADRGTTGGYTKIATVISVDLSLLAQATAGDTITFAAVTVDEAHALVRAQAAELARLSAGPVVRFARQRFRATVDAVACEVEADLSEVADQSPTAGHAAGHVRTLVRVTGDGGAHICRVEAHPIDQ